MEYHLKSQEIFQGLNPHPNKALTCVDDGLIGLLSSVLFSFVPNFWIGDVLCKLIA